MVLAHDQVEFPGPLVVVLAEPAILKAIGVDLPMLLPEEKQGHALAKVLAYGRPPDGTTPGNGAVSQSLFPF
jgi:hypothetical protein